MAYFFERWAVALAYHAEHRNVGTVSEGTLRNYDATLQGQYESAMIKAAADAGIELTEGNKATLIILAVTSNPGTPRSQMEDACMYFEGVWPP